MKNLPTNHKTVSAPSLQERAAHREWIGGRIVTLLSHYWRDDDPVELTAAIGADWAEVLEGIPQEYIQRACIAHLRHEKRKPTPASIYAAAKKLMPKPSLQEPKPEPVQRVTAERAAEIMAQAGFAPKRFGGDA